MTDDGFAWAGPDIPFLPVTAADRRRIAAMRKAAVARAIRNELARRRSDAQNERWLRAMGVDPFEAPAHWRVETRHD